MRAATRSGERLDGLVQLDTEFHRMKGKRHVITFITGSENDPRVLGLTPVDAFATSFPVRQDDDDNVDIPADGDCWRLQVNRFLSGRLLFDRILMMR